MRPGAPPAGGPRERSDGNGYPDDLRAEECPEGASIMALADTRDVMTSERPHTPVAHSAADALRERRAHAGGRSWPRAVEAPARLKGGS